MSDHTERALFDALRSLSIDWEMFCSGIPRRTTEGLRSQVGAALEAYRLETEAEPEFAEACPVAPHKSEARGECDERALEAEQWHAAFDRAAAECVDLRVLLAVQRTNCTKALDQKDSFGRENASLKTQVAALEDENQRLLAKGHALAKQVDTARAEAEELNARLMAAGSPLPDLAGNSLKSPWRKHPRLARLDALLASEEPPEGLALAILAYPFKGFAENAWRWFREAFGQASGETKPADGETIGRSEAFDPEEFVDACPALIPGDPSTCPRGDCDLCPLPPAEDVQGEPEGGEIERLQGAAFNFLSEVVTIRQSNTIEWMAYIAQAVNTFAEALGDGDRVRFNGDGLTIIRAAAEGRQP